jgi:DNA-binding response OmpR family regulator
MIGQLSFLPNGCPPTQTVYPFIQHGVRPMATHTIILIDDDRAWLRATGELLRGEGFAVEEAEDGVCGLELLDRSSPVLVILDVHLPRLDGFEVLREVRQRGQQVPILMMSGEDQASLVTHALAEGASCFLRKPVAAEVLLRAVRRLVGISKDRGSPR